MDNQTQKKIISDMKYVHDDDIEECEINNIEKKEHELWQKAIKNAKIIVDDCDAILVSFDRKLKRVSITDYQAKLQIEAGCSQEERDMWQEFPEEIEWSINKNKDLLTSDNFLFLTVNHISINYPRRSIIGVAKISENSFIILREK